jgi:hypothetical protein
MEERTTCIVRAVDGGEEKRLLEEPILGVETVSPEGKWVVVVVSKDADAEHPYRTVAFPIAGGQAVVLCRTICSMDWNMSGTYVHLNLYEGMKGITYFVPVEKAVGLPKLDAQGVIRGEEVRVLGKIGVVGEGLDSAVSPEVYSLTRTRVKRNLYRMPLE